MSDAARLERVVHRWLEIYILGLNLCPFAHPVVNRQQLEFCFADGCQHSTLQELFDACENLQADDVIETVLLILDKPHLRFDDFLDLVALGEALLENFSLDTDFKLVGFHPDYLHDGLEEGAPEHYSNRSPIALIQILRRTSVDKAAQPGNESESITRDRQPHPLPVRLPDGAGTMGFSAHRIEQILARNTERLNSVGVEALQKLLDQCWQCM